MTFVMDFFKNQVKLSENQQINTARENLFALIKFFTIRIKEFEMKSQSFIIFLLTPCQK